MSRMYSAYVAHKHSRNISFTKLCETNQSHPGRCGVVALWRCGELVGAWAQCLLSALGCLLSTTLFPRRPLAGLLAF
jgi:hypothetical protein